MTDAEREEFRRIVLTYYGDKAAAELAERLNLPPHLRVEFNDAPIVEFLGDPRPTDEVTSGDDKSC